MLENKSIEISMTHAKDPINSTYRTYMSLYLQTIHFFHFIIYTNLFLFERK